MGCETYYEGVFRFALGKLPPYFSQMVIQPDMDNLIGDGFGELMLTPQRLVTALIASCDPNSEL